MLLSDHIKACFKTMTKMGDIEVIGTTEVINKRLILISPPVGLDKEESEILPKVLTDERGQDTSVYL